MALSCQVDKQWFQEQINETAHDLFKAKPGKPQLQVYRASGASGDVEKVLLRNIEIEDVHDVSQLKALKNV